MLVLVSVVVFAVIRRPALAAPRGPPVTLLRVPPRRRLARPVHDLQRRLEPAALPRRADQHRASSPTRSGAFASEWVASVLAPLGDDGQRGHRDGRDPPRARDHPGVPRARGAQQAPAHHHGGVQRRVLAADPGPSARCCRCYSEGKPVDFEDPGEDDLMGRGKIEDFTWKGLLDFATCTECGRCQSQCPAWNTGKPLSPKLLVMSLRDHALAKAPVPARRGRRGAGGAAPGRARRGRPAAGRRRGRRTA